MRDLEILDILDRLFRDKYENSHNLEIIGHSITKKAATLKYKEDAVTIELKVPKKNALLQYFIYKKDRGQFKKVTFEKFQEKYDEGIPFEDIEKEVKKEQLPLED